MSVLLIKGHPPRYIGLSTDAKPEIDSEALLEAEFIETDTKLTYVYTGDQWVEKTATYVPMKNYIWNESELAWEAATNKAVVYGKTGDATYQVPRVDPSTHSLQVIEYSHHEIHAGSSFTCHFSQSAPTNIGDMTIIAFTTPDTAQYIHMFAEASSTAASTFTVYEIADLDVDEGTQLTIYNRNRNSLTASAVKSIETVPVANKATSYTVAQAAGATLSTTNPIYQKYLGAGVAGADTAGETRDAHEFVLKRNTQYAWVVASTTADDNTHNIVLNWYEHTDKAA